MFDLELINKMIPPINIAKNQKVTNAGRWYEVAKNTIKKGVHFIRSDIVLTLDIKIMI